MFRPEKMSFVNISVLDSYMTQVLDSLTKLSVIHVIDKNELVSGVRGVEDIDVSPMRRKLNELSTAVESLLSTLSIEISLPFGSSSENVDDVEIDPFQIAEKVGKELSDIGTEVNPVAERIARAEAKIAELEEQSRRIALVETEGLRIEEIREPEFLNFSLGDIPREFYQRLIGSLTHVPCVIIPKEVRADRQQILVFSLKSDKEAVSNALEAAYFSKAGIPPDYSGNVTDVLDQIELEIWTNREEVADLRAEMRALRKKWREKLLELHTTIVANLVLLDSMEHFGKTDSTYFVSGWVPHSDVPKLRKRLEKITEQGILLEVSEPITAEEAVRSKIDVPTKFKHPAFLRPFKGLITTFSVPRYADLDPTLLTTITFLIMFGVMFADVGHGGVLLLLGLVAAFFPSPLLRPMRQLSLFVASAGGASVIAGFTFGNVFGNEDIIKPLWFSLEHMNPVSVSRMLAFGVYFGIGMVTLGIFLSIAQAIRQKNYTEAFFGKWGLFSLTSYWTALFLFITHRQFTWYKILIIVLLLLPIMLKEQVPRFIRKKKEVEEGGEEEQASIIESGFEIYETVMAYLSNTLSYIRMAAFNLSHAGLMMASYSLTRQLGGDSSLLISLPSNIMANIFVIALEGLIVMIQCMRLEYYEFFSKFFGGGGIEYRPLTIQTSRDKVGVAR